MVTAGTETRDTGETVELREHTSVPHESFFPGFDGLRAIAALLVLVNHAWLASGYRRQGPSQYLSQFDIGVPVFFVISGFLLYRPFVAARLADRQPMGFGEFWKRRALRIFPAYWAALLFVSLFMYNGSRPIDSLRTFFLHVPLLHIYSSDRVINGPVQQSWTLAVEIAFYLFLPFYAWIMARLRPRRVSPLVVELAGVAVLYVLSLVYRVSLLSADLSFSDVSWYRTWLPGFMDQLAIGMGLAVLSAWLARRDRGDRRAPRLLAPVSWVLAALCFWIVATRLDLPIIPVAPRTGRQFLEEQFFRGAFALFLVLPAVFASPREGLIRRFLSARLMVWLGLISYGIYLWHEAWLDVYLRWRGISPFTGSFPELLTVCLLLTVPTAALSYYVIERPALRLKNRSLWVVRRRPTVPVARP